MLFREDSFFVVPEFISWRRSSIRLARATALRASSIGYLAQQGFDLQAGHISRQDLSRAVIYGSVMGSFCCERFGVERFRTLKRSEIDARFEEVPSASLRSDTACLRFRS